LAILVVFATPFLSPDEVLNDNDERDFDECLFGQQSIKLMSDQDPLIRIYSVQERRTHAVVDEENGQLVQAGASLFCCFERVSFFHFVIQEQAQEALETKDDRTLGT
jgi:hypothetical protein